MGVTVEIAKWENESQIKPEKPSNYCTWSNDWSLCWEYDEVQNNRIKLQLNHVLIN